MKRIAAIDLGTNTFLCLIADIDAGKIIRVIHDEARVVRLGQGVHQNKRLHPEALERADDCLAAFAAVIEKHDVDKTVACATSAARDVSNGAELLTIGNKHGIEIEIISGEREAECTYWGTVGRDLRETVGIIDVGGGSTEFMIGDKTGIKKKISVDVGSVRLTEMFVTKHPIPKFERDKLETYISTKLSVLKTTFAGFHATKTIAVAGTPTTLAAVDMGKPFDAPLVHGYLLSLAKLKSWTDQMAQMTIEERQRISGMDPKRADVIAAGAAVLARGCEAMGAKELEVSIQGLRYGLALLAGESK